LRPAEGQSAEEVKKNSSGRVPGRRHRP
jgi:hypothetical protein